MEYMSRLYCEKSGWEADMKDGRRDPETYRSARSGSAARNGAIGGQRPGDSARNT